MWLYEGTTYQQHMIECSGIAGVWNSQRTKKSDRVWLYTDFHPAHQKPDAPKGKTGSEVLQGVACWFDPSQIEWADGYSVSKL